jgi:hypothetical protein
MKAQRFAPQDGDPANGKETIAYAELLKIAHEEGLKSIGTQLLVTPNEENGRLAIVKAVVEVERGRFEGIGDADPSSVESFLAPHLIRVAETRAKARALRDAVNCGVVSFEELGGVRPRTESPSPGSGAPPAQPPRVPQRRGGTPPRSANRTNGADEPMTEAQRRYLFRLMSGQGYQREAAEERLKDLFEVSALTEITKAAATKMIDQLLNSAPERGGGNGADARPQR